jgi:enediyne biosynthesis thioesterase
MRHVVSLEETNIVGNVYYANHVRWQGRCRELFLRDFAPEVLTDLANGKYLVTTRVSCEYFDELRAFDAVVVRMYAKEIAASRLTMSFDYYRVEEGREQLVARGEQQVASMAVSGGAPQSTPLPAALRAALEPFLR